MQMLFSTVSGFWLIAVIALLVLEGLTVSLVSIWFAVGAAAALLVSLMGGGLLLQAAVFAIVSFAVLVLMKPIADRARRSPTVATNGDRNIGRTGCVVEPIRPELPGRIRLDGVDWSARTADGSALEKGALCRVTAIESTTLVVTAEPQNAPAAP